MIIPWNHRIAFKVLPVPPLLVHTLFWVYVFKTEHEQLMSALWSEAASSTDNRQSVSTFEPYDRDMLEIKR
jgi:hypothetical protein